MELLEVAINVRGRSRKRVADDDFLGGRGRGRRLHRRGGGFWRLRGRGRGRRRGRCRGAAHVATSNARMTNKQAKLTLRDIGESSFEHERLKTSCKVRFSISVTSPDRLLSVYWSGRRSMFVCVYPVARREWRTCTDNWYGCNNGGYIGCRRLRGFVWASQAVGEPLQAPRFRCCRHPRWLFDLGPTCWWRSRRFANDQCRARSQHVFALAPFLQVTPEACEPPGPPFPRWIGSRW